MFERLREGLTHQAELKRNRPFLEATMAGAALVAAADGTVSLSERMRVDQILERLDQLKIYDPHIGVDLFNEVLDALAEDPVKGEALAMERIGKLGDQPEDCRLMVRICYAVSEADGQFSPSELSVITRICSALKIELDNALA